MATRKKAKPKTKSKKTSVKKRPAGKKAVKKKAAVRRPAPKKKLLAKKPPVRAAAVKKPAPLPGEERVGTVIHYYSHLSVAIVRLESGSLREGDTIHVKGHTSDFRQRVQSMEIDHVHVPEARPGQEFGLKVIEHAREHDAVYKVGA